MCNRKPLLFGLVLTCFVTSAETRSTSVELADLDRLSQEIALVRQFTTGLQEKHSQEQRVRFRYEAVIGVLSSLESDIEDHIQFKNQMGGDWERFVE